MAPEPIGGGSGGGSGGLPPVGARGGAGDAFSASKHGLKLKAKPIFPPGIYRFEGTYYEERKIHRGGGAKSLQLQPPRLWEGACDIQIKEEISGDKGFKGLNARINDVEILLIAAGGGKLTCTREVSDGVRFFLQLYTDMKVREDEQPRFEFHVTKKSVLLGKLLTIETVKIFRADLGKHEKDPGVLEYRPCDVKYIRT